MNVWTNRITLAILFSCAWADGALRAEQEILQNIFNGYDSRIRPVGKKGKGPVIVEVNTYVRRLNDLDDVKMLFTAELTFRQRWFDERLKYQSRADLDYVTLKSPDKIWVPDLFFSNEMQGHFHNMLAPNNLIRIYPDGTVLYSTRVSLDLFCQMDLKNYPMDKQACSIKAASYSYTKKDVVFQWKAADPIQLSKSLYLPKFSLNGFEAHNGIRSVATGEYSYIHVDFHFSRDFTSYLLRAFIPSMYLVMLSWITFWLPPRSISVRLGIWIGVLLSLMIVTTSVAEKTPVVSYITAIDVWLGTCIVYVFCVLLEMVLVYNAFDKHNRLGLKNQIAMEEAMSEHKGMDIDDGVKGNSSRPQNYTSTPLRWLNKYSTRAQRVDAISRILFPATFTIFAITYWLTCTLK